MTRNPENANLDAVAGQSGTSAGAARLAHLLLPMAILVLALTMPHLIFWPDQPADMGGLGPGAWPTIMLYAMAICAAIWLMQEGRAIQLGRPVILGAPTDDETYHFGKALIGIGLILAYGWLLHITGFALTTAAFLMIWCYYGGLRKPLVVIPVALIGTAVLLWGFMGAALMPLSRGKGIFDTISIWILQMLGIY